MWVTCRVPQPGELGTDIEMSVPKPVCPTSPLLHQAPHTQPGRLSVAENNSQPFRQTSQVQHMQLPRLWADPAISHADLCRRFTGKHLAAFARVAVRQESGTIPLALAG